MATLPRYQRPSRRTTCGVCHGQLVGKTIEFDGKWGERRIIFSEVPADVCAQCGNTYVWLEVSKRIEELAMFDEPPDSFVQVPLRKYRPHAPCPEIADAH